MLYTGVSLYAVQALIDRTKSSVSEGDQVTYHDIVFNSVDDLQIFLDQEEIWDWYWVGLIPTQEAIPFILPTVSGVLGAIVASLRRNRFRKHTLSSIIAGIAFGSAMGFVASVLSLWTLKAAIPVGFLGGLFADETYLAAKERLFGGKG